MKRSVTLAASTLAFLLTNGAALAGEFEVNARVEGVGDGDTIYVRLADNTKATIRIAPIDAPETCHHKRDPACTMEPGQPFGEEAGDVLRQMILDRTVRLRCEGRKTYGREVCEVFLGSEDVSQVMVSKGLAWYIGGSRWPHVKAAELGARLGRRGLWSQPTPIRPSDWRKMCWQRHVCPGVGARL